jgi:hypothetical protein
MRGISIDGVVESYWEFLDRSDRHAHLVRFKQRLESDIKAAQAEAVVFSLLWASGAHPDIFEDISTGGPDFICQPDGNSKFLVEVTSLESAAVARRSNLPEEIKGRGGTAFGLLTTALDSAAASKVAQLAKHPSYPRALAITSSHAFSAMLMDDYAALRFLVSDLMISHRVGDPNDPGEWVTDLRKSAFLRTDESGRVVPIRQSISAILLVAIYPNQANVVGILHPEPRVAFSPALLWRIPYVCLRNWPIADNKLQTECIHAGENPAIFHHARIC